MAVSRFRITANALEPRVRQAAKDSANVVFIPAPEKRSMAGAMLFQQAMSCLREGRISGRPVFTEDGLWEFRMKRYAASQWFSIKVAASVAGARVEKLYVILSED